MSSNRHLNIVDTTTGEITPFTVECPIARNPEGLINICKYAAFAVKENQVCAIGSSASVLGINPCVDFTSRKNALEALNRIAAELHKCGKQ